MHALANGVVDLASVDQAFLCGPEGMIAEARSALQALGLPDERIRSELFTAATPRRHFRPAASVKPREVVAHVSVKLDGKRHDFDMLASDDNVIDAAARAGIDPPIRVTAACAAPAAASWKRARSRWRSTIRSKTGK